MNNLKNELQELRFFLEDKWKEWKINNNYTIDDDDTLSRDMCRFTSVFLYRWLIDKYPEYDWKIKGGISNRQFNKLENYDLQGGYNCHDIWFGHFWIQNENTIIDLTADQFNGDEIIMTSINDKRYNNNMSDTELIGAMLFGSEDAHEWYSVYIDNIITNKLI
jgi:hypothetical protein